MVGAIGSLPISPWLGCISSAIWGVTRSGDRNIVYAGTVARWVGRAAFHLKSPGPRLKRRSKAVIRHLARNFNRGAPGLARRPQRGSLPRGRQRLLVLCAEGG